MKPLICFIAFISSISVSYSSEIPTDIQNVVAARDQATKKIDMDYTDALLKLQRKYTQNKDSKNLTLIESLLKNSSLEKLLAAAVATQNIAGKWIFNYKNRERKFQFFDDHVFQGQYPISGKTFAGVWRIDENKIILIRDGTDFGSVEIKSSGYNASFESGEYKMTGRKSDK